MKTFHSIVQTALKYKKFFNSLGEEDLSKVVMKMLSDRLRHKLLISEGWRLARSKYINGYVKADGKDLLITH